MPDFTIITPVLNEAKHLEKCILSVLGQDCDIQFIVMDGGSTDGTIDIIRKYEDRISYWISEPDSGQSHAINKGLKLADGKFFNWLNADDQLTENALKTVLEIATDETKVVVGKCEHIDKNGNQTAVGSARIRDSVEATLGNYSMGQPSVFYRTVTAKHLGGLNEQLHYCMDMDLWFRYLVKFGQENVAETASILSRFLVHSSSKSVGFKLEMENEKYGIYRGLLSQFDLPDMLKSFLSNYAIPKIKLESYSKSLNKTELLANFCWHLMVDAYAKNDLEKCQSYFSIVAAGNRLSKADKLIWKTRLASKQILGI